MLPDHPVVPGAVEQLLGHETHHVHVAGGSPQDLFVRRVRMAYFDHSKNRSRSWCEYGCGNKIKTRSYRARQRAARVAEGT